MTPASFRAWRVRLYGERGQKAAADALGCSRTSIRAWESGTNAIPKYIGLACRAIGEGLPPMGEKTAQEWRDEAIDFALKTGFPKQTPS